MKAQVSVHCFRLLHSILLSFRFNELYPITDFSFEKSPRHDAYVPKFEAELAQFCEKLVGYVPAVLPSPSKIFSCLYPDEPFLIFSAIITGDGLR